MLNSERNLTFSEYLSDLRKVKATEYCLQNLLKARILKCCASYELKVTNLNLPI